MSTSIETGLLRLEAGEFLSAGVAGAGYAAVGEVADDGFVMDWIIDPPIEGCIFRTHGDDIFCIPVWKVT